jgi:hypothetical protein
MNTNEKAVAAVLAKYQDALNQSDTNGPKPPAGFVPLYVPAGRQAGTGRCR